MTDHKQQAIHDAGETLSADSMGEREARVIAKGLVALTHALLDIAAAIREEQVVKIRGV